jgi:PHD/YefM family antitoxin component YafN of YafNO toxin-antitoxin module
MSVITANEIKKRGVACITESLAHSPEAAISVRGKNAYVVMSMEQYQYLRECELEAALLETRRDRESGRVVHHSVAEHIKSLQP